MHNANEKQVGGTHYATGSVQHWDYVQQALCGAYLMGNVTKYVARHRRKNGLEDLEKAKHYLQKVMELYQSGELKPARSPGDIGKMPAVVKNFIDGAGMCYWEARVMILACLWSNLNELVEMRAMIDHMVEAVHIQERMDGFSFDHYVEDAGAGYVDQDRGCAALPVDDLESFALWLSVQSPCIVVGSSAETPVILEAVKRYRDLTTDCAVRFDNTLNFGGDVQPSKRKDDHCLRCDATAIAVVSAHSNPESYVTKDFVPHDWVVDAVVCALQRSNLNGS